MDHQFPACSPALVLINKKKRNCHLEDFAIPADHRVKMKESKKGDKYLDATRKLKLPNMKVAEISILGKGMNLQQWV